MNFAAEKHKEIARKIEVVVSPNSGLVTMCQFQPLTESMVQHRAEDGGTMIRLEEHITDTTETVFLVYLVIDRPGDEDTARPFVQELMDSFNDYEDSISIN
ncbi:hypothetical protein HD806DRAFT_534143 [Xylariaceae sp. AK1471]|nr:hypothetical protein HD806DRAFT_534143 [Xylariaceae sp. AK1471]